MRCFGLSMPISVSRLQSCGVSVLSLGRVSRILPRPRHQHLQPGTSRSASTSINDIYAVPVGSNGHVSLSVVQPKTAIPAPGNVIIRLPQGPIFQKPLAQGRSSLTSHGNGAETPTFSAAEDTAAARALAAMTSSTVVTINYRLGESDLSPDAKVDEDSTNMAPSNKKIFYRYPSPVHDTLAGFDWVLENLQPNRLGVIGTHIGGSLALMLALTEPRSVRAVAALEPVCDWTSLDEYCTLSSVAASSRRKTRHAPRDLVPLLEARARFFTTQEKYFDAFASPILFLRSAGKNVPKRFPKYLTGPDYPVPVLATEESEDSPELWDAYVPDDYIYDNDGAETSNVEGSGPDLRNEDNPPPGRRRKALSRWPPYSLDYGISGPRQEHHQSVERLDVALPWVRLFAHRDKDTSNSANSSSNEPEAESPGHSNELPPRRSPPKRHRRNQNETVLAHQAIEMADVMRRACFWGREKGFAEKRVTLSSVPLADSDRTSDSEPSTSSSDIKEMDSLAGKWLVETLNSEVDIDA